MSANIIKSLLRDKYPDREWALAFEVADSPGGATKRFADAVAMNLWPSRGLGILGFEFKVNRSDWLKELRQPDKAEPIARYCDQWWIVATRGVVKPGELPDLWGLMEVGDDRLVVVKEAPKKEAAALTREFLASLFRRQSGADRALIEVEVARQAEAYRKRFDEQFEWRVRERVEMSTHQHQALLKALEDIKVVTGIDLAAWQHKTQDFGKAVNFVLNCKVHGSYGSMQYVLSNLRESLERVESVINCHESGVDFVEPEPKIQRAMKRQTSRT
jgi:hypothetical protein